MFSVFQVTSKSVSFSQTFAIQLHLFSIFLRYFRYFINSVFSSDTLDTSFIHYFPQILPSRALYLPPLPILANSQSPFHSLLRRVVTPLPLSPVRPPFTANLTISSPEPLSRLTENSFVSPHLIHPVSQHQTCHLYQFSLPLQPIRQVKLLATRPYCLRQLWREIHPLSLHSYFADLILCSAISFSSDAPRAGP